MSVDLIPSKDPGSDSGLGAMLRQVFTKILQTVDGMLPATVVSYNRATNRATIVPSINMVTTAGTALRRAPYANLPVLALGGGGLVINFPLKPGNTGWVEASDRDISLWLQGGGKSESWPNTQRMHSFSDGRFIPDVLSKYTIAAGVADDEMVIQTEDGGTVIALGPDRVYVAAPKVEIKSQVFIDGELTVNGIAFTPHTHGGVTIGGGSTAAPNP